MRLIKTLAGIIAVMLLIAGCKKSSEVSNTSFEGTWGLRQVYGDIGTINYPAGNNSTLTFKAGAYTNRDTTKGVTRHPTGTYMIVSDNSAEASTGFNIKDGQFTNRLILDNDPSAQKIFIQITNNNLVLLTGYFPTDGGVQLTYVKN